MPGMLVSIDHCRPRQAVERGDLVEHPTRSNRRIMPGPRPSRNAPTRIKTPTFHRAFAHRRTRLEISHTIRTPDVENDRTPPKTLTDDPDQLLKGPTPMTETPASLGYRMPAEWEPHEATWIAWPHNRDDWPGKFGPIPWVYVEIVRAPQPVRAGRDPGQRRQGRSGRPPTSSTGPGSTSTGSGSTGSRPTGSGPATRGRPSSSRTDDPADPDGLALVDWEFNAWAKYDNHLRDRKVPRRLAKILGSEAVAKPRVDPATAASRPASCSKGARSTSTARGRC